MIKKKCIIAGESWQTNLFLSPPLPRPYGAVIIGDCNGLDTGAPMGRTGGLIGRRFENKFIPCAKTLFTSDVLDVSS